MSNATHVTLRNVGFNLSGNFTCEVTADAPSFYTATATNFLQVVGEFTALIGSLVHIEIHNETKFK